MFRLFILLFGSLEHCGAYYLPKGVRHECRAFVSACAADAKHGRLQALEADLTAAVSEENYSAAALLRDKVASLRLDDEVSIIAANADFYRAFSERDMKLMERVWKDEPASFMCAHPGFPPLYGRDKVMESWQQIFNGSDLEVTPTEVRLMRVGANSAVVNCVETLGSSGDSKLVATNIFENTESGRWRMVLHQAGPIMVA